MDKRYQYIAAYCGLLCPILLGIGLLPMAGFLPPHAPTTDAVEIARIYSENGNAIRFGMFFLMLGGALYAPLVALISYQMNRIKNDNATILSYIQMASGAPVSILIIAPGLIWSLASYRNDISPEIIRMLNDLGWLIFIMPFTLGFIENITIGLAILSDKGKKPIFPRWLGFFNIWVAILIIPAGIIAFFKTGPFAWNGIIGFWVPASAFFIWLILMFYYLKVAIKEQ